MQWPGGRIRRSRHFALRMGPHGEWIACATLAGREYLIESEEVRLLSTIESDVWQAVDPGHSKAELLRLGRMGLVLFESGTGELAEFCRREEQLRVPPWHAHAALFHSLTRWNNVHSITNRSRLSRQPDRWPPAPHFHHPDGVRSVAALPRPAQGGEFFDVVARRRTTTRDFDPHALITADALSTLLYWVWGCYGTRVIVPGELTILRKTSPGAGAQHATEVYPLVRGVEGVAPGLYHYSVEHHQLELLDPLDGRDPVSVNHELLADQDHLSGASVVFYMTTRFSRMFWKYPRHQKTYRTTLFDAGHLSQTHYLVAARLGLGAFVTAAFNEEKVDRLLGLAPFTEAAVLACGVGHPANPSDEPHYEHYVPWATT